MLNVFNLKCLHFWVLATPTASPFGFYQERGDTFGQYAKSSSNSNFLEGVTKSVLQGIHGIVQPLLVLNWLDFWLGWVQRNVWPWRCTNWQLVHLQHWLWQYPSLGLTLPTDMPHSSGN